MNKQDIQDYLKAGAPYEEGVRLFLLAKGNKHPFAKLLQKKTKGTHQVLVNTLCQMIGLNPVMLNDPRRFVTLSGVEVKKSFREDFPFLDLPDCPPELKILAANKISAYRNYTRGHFELFGCYNNQEQYNTVKKVVENYIENRLIMREFEYYKRHNDVLGIHPIFASFRKLQELRKLGVVELVKKRDKILHNIWRIESEIKKNKQPHLQVDREQRLQERKNELAEIERILKSYG